MSGRAVREVAHAVDRRLVEQDVRLTMGGEPTFVGIDEPESPQWNLEALGPIKRSRGLDSDPAPARADGARRPAALRPGKVVSGRASAALGLPVHLPRRWRSGLGRRETSSRGKTTNTSFGLGDSLRFLEALSRRLQVTEAKHSRGVRT